MGGASGNSAITHAVNGGGAPNNSMTAGPKMDQKYNNMTLKVNSSMVPAQAPNSTVGQQPPRAAGGLFAFFKKP